MALSKLQRRKRIKQRVRKIVSGTAARPRLSVYRSNKGIYAQLINDEAIASGSKSEVATAVGKAIAEAASKAGIDTCSFDRNGYLYHGRVKTLAEAAREAGLKF